MGFLYYSLLKKKYFLRKEKAKGIMLQDFKLHYETIIIKKKQFGTSTKIDTLTRIKSQHIQPTNI